MDYARKRYPMPAQRNECLPTLQTPKPEFHTIRHSCQSIVLPLNSSGICVAVNGVGKRSPGLVWQSAGALNQERHVLASRRRGIHLRLGKEAEGAEAQRRSRLASIILVRASVGLGDGIGELREAVAHSADAGVDVQAAVGSLLDEAEGEALLACVSKPCLTNASVASEE